jgi:hypothetical protein
MNPDVLRENLQMVLRDKRNIHLVPREARLPPAPAHIRQSRVPVGSECQAHTRVVGAQPILGHSLSSITLDVFTHLMQDAQRKTADAVFSRPAVPAVAPEKVN